MNTKRKDVHTSVQINDSQAILRDLCDELTTLHHHYYPECGGGCPSCVLIRKAYNLCRPLPNSQQSYQRLVKTEIAMRAELKQIHNHYPMARKI